MQLQILTAARRSSKRLNGQTTATKNFSSRMKTRAHLPPEGAAPHVSSRGVHGLPCPAKKAGLPPPGASGAARAASLSSQSFFVLLPNCTQKKQDGLHTLLEMSAVKLKFLEAS